MNVKTAAAIFEILASGARLAVFRLLVKYAPDGLVAGDISRLLDIPKTNLSFHLKNIVHCGLAGMEREGRNIRYKANIALMQEMIVYLTEECCTGNRVRNRVKNGALIEKASACRKKGTSPAKRKIQARRK